MSDLTQWKTSPNFIDSRNWGPGQSAIYLKDPFDSQILGRTCAKVELLADINQSPRIANDIRNDLKSLEVDYATVRLASRCFWLVPRLSSEGFVVVDSMVEFSKTPDHHDVSRSIHRQAGRFSENIENLAASAFQQSRYHNDPEIEKKSAELIYRTWAANIVSGKVADACHVAVCDDGEFAGFVSITGRETYSDIGLIAIGSDRTGRGLGKQLVQSAEVWSKEQKFPELRVKTQTFNIPAIRLYQSCGFSIFETFTTLRWTRD